MSIGAGVASTRYDVVSSGVAVSEEVGVSVRTSTAISSLGACNVIVRYVFAWCFLVSQMCKIVHFKPSIYTVHVH